MPRVDRRLTVLLTRVALLHYNPSRTEQRNQLGASAGFRPDQNIYVFKYSFIYCKLIPLDSLDPTTDGLLSYYGSWVPVILRVVDKPTFSSPTSKSLLPSVMSTVLPDSGSSNVYYSHSVWVFARPLSLARYLPSLGSASDGNFPLCHWGVFVTDLSNIDVLAITNRLRATIDNPTTDLELGDLYELERLDKTLYTVKISRPFRVSEWRKSWLFSPQFVGSTEMSFGQISLQGK